MGNEDPASDNVVYLMAMYAKALHAPHPVLLDRLILTCFPPEGPIRSLGTRNRISGASTCCCSPASLASRWPQVSIRRSSTLPNSYLHGRIVCILSS